MRLQDVPMGGSFEYEGQVFTKTGPMTAAATKGGQRLIPRSAILSPVGTNPDGLDRKAVLAAFDAFYRTCNRLTDESSRAELAAARQRFLDKLK